MRILFVVLVLSLVLFCLVEAAKQDKKRKHAKIDVGRRRKQAKTTKKQGIRRRTLQKTVKSGNAKSVARANEVGNGCDYVVLSELPTRAKGCVNGAKFVIRPGSNSRRQYVIMNGKPLLLWVTRGTKFTDCTAFTDRTASISCKEVTGLAAIDLGVTGAPGTNTTAAPSSAFKCGVKKPGTRIVGGVPTQVNEYPWMVRLQLTINGQTEPLGCGATLVAQEWAITATHCMGGLKASDLAALLGEDDTETTSETTLTKSFPVSKIINHPNFQDVSNDITLLKLSSKVDLNKYTPVCLPAPDTSWVGKTAWVYGWGATSFGGFSSNKLLEVPVVVVNLDTCRSPGGVYQDVEIGMVCAGGVKGEDSCQGDSGGPLTVPDATTQQHSLAGIVSWGDGCAQAGKYGVYTDVSFYRGWIQEQFDANGGATLVP